MKHTGLKGETEGLMTTAQDQASTSSSKEPQTDAECAIPSQKMWNTSYQGAKH